MNFEQLDARMRVFETCADQAVLPGVFMVARLDGRSFTRLTKQTHAFEVPFDVRFRDMMVETTRFLMRDVGIGVVYGYTCSDEISLLFAENDQSFGRKLRKLNSVLAGSASAKFTALLGDVAVFDCRISQLPTAERVADYFRWRSEDACRNALNAHCYWALRAEGASATAATRALEGTSVSDKNELLFERCINFNELPAWQRRGCGVVWERYEKRGQNPKTGEVVQAQRRRLKPEFELPVRGAYEAYVLRALGVDG